MLSLLGSRVWENDKRIYIGVLCLFYVVQVNGLYEELVTLSRESDLVRLGVFLCVVVSSFL